MRHIFRNVCNKNFQIKFPVNLQRNFEQVSVKVVECPDLTLAPFGLAAPGLNGQTRIADVGGVPNLTPVPKPEKEYSLTDVLKEAELQDGAIIGPGAASSRFVGEHEPAVLLLLATFVLLLLHSLRSVNLLYGEYAN